MYGFCQREQLAVFITILCFSVFCPNGFAQSDLTAVRTIQDLSSPGAPGWLAITGVGLQTQGNPTSGGHGAVLGTLPVINIKAAYTRTRLFMRFEWDDATASNRNRILTFNGTTWSGSGDEDRLYVAWPIVDGPGRQGSTFAEIGCAVMCHQRNPTNGNTLVPNTTQTLAACSVCHRNSAELKPADFVHLSFAVPPADCSSCHGGPDREDISGGDMIAAAGSAYDIWHWKAQRSDPIGLAEDQFSANAVRRRVDGTSLSPDNTVSGVARYLFVSGATAVSTTSLLLRSQIPAQLAAHTLAEWNAANSRYQLSDGTSVTAPVGTQVTRHILEDQALGPSATVRARSSYAGGKWRVVLHRELVVPGESTPGAGTLSDTDYAFDVSTVNRFSVAVTDNSGINHKGVGRVSLAFEAISRTRNWRLYR
jgi:hypothetical protein